MHTQNHFAGKTLGVLILLVFVGGMFAFVEQKLSGVAYVGNEREKMDLIRIISPRPHGVIVSPLVISGEARGNWFFEASFPVFLTDWDGKIIAEGIATAQDEWMTTEFVPYVATLNFDTKDISGNYSNRGTLILKKDNPSGLPEHDDALEIPIRFAGVKSQTTTGEESATKTYTNAVYGFTFEYPETPDSYVITEQSSKSASDPVYTVVLMSQSEYEALTSSTDAREGPPTISVSVFKNTQKLSPQQWAKTYSAQSNIQLKVGDLAEVLIGGENAVRYLVDGLYLTDTVVVSRGSYVYVFSGGYLTDQSQIKKDFARIVDSVVFE